MHKSKTLIHFLLISWLCIPALVPLTGCGGCNDPLAEKPSEEEEAKEKEKKKKKKPDFDRMKMTILPGTIPTDDGDAALDDGGEIGADQGDGDDSDRVIRRVAAKPGHWVHARYQLKANNFDFNGELTAQCVNQRLAAMDLDRSPYWMTSTRPAVLPKAQSKDVEIPLFVSVPKNRDKRTIQILGRLKTWGGGRDVVQDAVPVLRLKPHQYHLVVLAENPDRFGYLRTLDTIKPPNDDWAMDGLQEDYVVTAHGSDSGERLPIPGNPLAWTSIAGVVWDNLPPDALDPEQQSAMLDWLHWGGMLVVSGPDSLDTMRGSFLDPYLPAKAGKTVLVTAEAFDECNETWSLMPTKANLEESAYLLGGDRSTPIEMVEIEPIAPAEFVNGTGKLVVERRIGRGRITVTAFSLTDRQVIDWRNFDGFVNGCLLRRPSRRFGDNGEFSNVTFQLGGVGQSSAALNTGLRYFTRDAAIQGERGDNARRSIEVEVRNPRRVADPVIDQLSSNAERRKLEEEQRAITTALGKDRDRKWGFDSSTSGLVRPDLFGYRSDPVGGIASWSDFSAVSNRARASLQEAAGISVPERRFVAKVLAAYLLCLVPINWLIFRLMRRVEFAWFAAPVIAVAGAFGIVKLAQLDIGFVRSRTEIAVVELQPDYGRAHVTRYCGLYTSLSSRYSATFEDSRAFAMPFSTNPSAQRLNLQKKQEVAYVRDKKVGMSGYPVLSNSTGMIHIEQMLPVGGKVGYSTSEEMGEEITNQTEWDLKTAVAVRRTNDGDVQVAVVGDLPIGEQATLNWTPVSDTTDFFSLLETDPVTATVTPEGEVSLRGLFRYAAHSGQLGKGDIRLISWTDVAVEGMELRPGSNQNTFRTLVISHLNYGKSYTPRADVNHIADHSPEPVIPELIDKP